MAVGYILPSALAENPPFKVGIKDLRLECVLTSDVPSCNPSSSACTNPNPTPTPNSSRTAPVSLAATQLLSAELHQAAVLPVAPALASPVLLQPSVLPVASLLLSVLVLLSSLWSGNLLYLDSSTFSLLFYAPIVLLRYPLDNMGRERFGLGFTMHERMRGCGRVVFSCNRRCGLSRVATLE